jgi:hypothetical protein
MGSIFGQFLDHWVYTKIVNLRGMKSARNGKIHGLQRICLCVLCPMTE